MHDYDLMENGLLIVTGSALRAEKNDRPLAYQLKSYIEKQFDRHNPEPIVIVLSDLMYLHAEPLHHLPVISLGGPRVNAVTARLLDKLPHALRIDSKLLIQMDPDLLELRVCIWGADHVLTANALQIFTRKNYLNRFLDAVVTRSR